MVGEEEERCDGEEEGVVVDKEGEKGEEEVWRCWEDYLEVGVVGGPFQVEVEEGELQPEG